MTHHTTINLHKPSAVARSATATDQQYIITLSSTDSVLSISSIRSSLGWGRADMRLPEHGWRMDGGFISLILQKTDL